MQADIKSICKKISEDKDISYDLIKAVGDSFFKYTGNILKNPPNLIINLKGIGKWYLRKQQMERKIEYLEDFYKFSENIYSEDFGKYIENKELKEKLESLLPLYEQYLKEKKEMFELRRSLGFIREIEIDEED